MSFNPFSRHPRVPALMFLSQDEPIVWWGLEFQRGRAGGKKKGWETLDTAEPPRNIPAPYRWILVCCNTWIIAQVLQQRFTNNTSFFYRSVEAQMSYKCSWISGVTPAFWMDCPCPTGPACSNPVEKQDRPTCGAEFQHHNTCDGFFG